MSCYYTSNIVTIATEFKLKDVDYHTSQVSHDLIIMDTCYYIMHLQYPQLVKETSHYKLWYRQDDIFKLFRGIVTVIP